MMHTVRNDAGRLAIRGSVVTMAQSDLISESSADRLKPLLVTIRFFLSAVFLYAAIQKVWGGMPSVLERTIYARMVNGRPVIHYGLVSFELALGIFLAFGLSVMRVAGVTCLFVSLTTGLLIAELARSNPSPCGCLGSVSTINLADINQVSQSLWMSIVRNGLILGSSAYLALASRPFAQPNE